MHQYAAIGILRNKRNTVDTLPAPKAQDRGLCHTDENDIYSLNGNLLCEVSIMKTVPQNDK